MISGGAKHCQERGDKLSQRGKHDLSRLKCGTCRIQTPCLKPSGGMQMNILQTRAWVSSELIDCIICAGTLLDGTQRE